MDPLRVQETRKNNCKDQNKILEKLRKYGVRLPKTVEEALWIDKETNTDFWAKALNKEMTKAKVSYEEVE